ncbi:MAG: histidinol phosphatase [Flavobacteriales bacterium]|nr:histidinol phosphatase [Flavobacteriales bacterium]
MSFWKRLYYRPKREQLPPADMSLVLTDMHSHLAAGIDDGAQTVEDAFTLIGQMYAMGYRNFITTPHIFMGVHNNTAAIITEAAEKVKQALSSSMPDVKYMAAAEYYLDEQFEKLIEDNALMTFGKKHVLFELSFASEQASLARAIFNMQLNGYKPVLAHPERYEYWHGNFAKYESMADKDVLLQLNITSLSGHYGPGVKRISERLIDAGLISLLGSDCHHMGHVELMQVARTCKPLHKLIESGTLKNRELWN